MLHSLMKQPAPSNEWSNLWPLEVLKIVFYRHLFRKNRSSEALSGDCIGTVLALQDFNSGLLKGLRQFYLSIVQMSESVTVNGFPETTFEI